ncbi:MAG: carbon-nitrogen hydrolase family protein [Opitutaceae bacterium]|nr:carbon-nitrogen hydrolase family protein [Opitutaceae bacterium]
MANYVKISTIGAPTLPVKPGSNEEALEIMKVHWQKLFSEVLPDRPDVIVVPEACDRFPAHTHDERKEYYRFRGNQMRDFFAEIAKEHRCYIAYSAAREVEDGTWRNSTQLIDRNGEILGIYNKNHLVIEETTEGEILCGKDAPIFECDFGRVALAICFDLNFDELRLKYKEAKPDLILFSSMYHGGLMQRYWAYSCRAHFVGSIARNHGSSIISPVGEFIASTTNYFGHVTATVNLDCKVVHLDYNWERLRKMKAKYGSKVSMMDPGDLGSVLISSETDEFTIEDMIKEFELEPWDDYYDRAMAHRHEPGNIEP